MQDRIEEYQDQKIVKIFLYGIFLWAFIIRFIRFSHGGPVSFDEAWSWWLGSQNLIKLLAIAATDKHPPLFYLFMHFWNLLYYSEIWIRIPSLLASLVNVWLFYKLASLIIKNSYFVLLALLLFALDGEQLWYTVIARSYAVTTTFCLMSGYTFIAYLKRKEGRWDRLNFVANLFLLLLTYMGVFAYIIEAGIVFTLYLKRRISKEAFKPWLKLNLIVLVILFSLVPYMIVQYRAGGFAPKWIAKMVGTPYLGNLMAQITVLNYNLFSLKASGLNLVVQFVLVAIAIIPVLIILYRKETDLLFSGGFIYLTLIYLIPVITFWLISKIEPIFISRYFMMFYFAYYIAVVYLIEKAAYPLIVNILLAGFLIYAFASPTLDHLNRDNEWETNWPKESMVIKKNWQKGDVLFVIPLADLVRAKFYLKNLNKYKISKPLYHKVFRSRTRAVTTTGLDSAFMYMDRSFHRMWFHEEIKTGLAAEFFLQPREKFIYNYLKKRFPTEKKFQYKDEHGILELFLLKPPTRFGERIQNERSKQK